jgi:thioredoxin 1
MPAEPDPELAALRARRLAELERLSNTAQEAPVVLTDASFDAFVAQHHTVVVDCWAPWCPPCRAMSPIIDELAAKWAGKVTFGKLNTDENQETAARFAITSIPTLLIFRDGEFADQVVGLPPKAQLIRMLSPLAA